MLRAPGFSGWHLQICEQACQAALTVPDMFGMPPSVLAASEEKHTTMMKKGGG